MSNVPTSPVAVPVAPTKPHVWARPTGDVADPYAWMRDRDDPDTIAYLESENAYATAYFAADGRAGQVETIFQEIKSRVQETDLSVPVFDDGWWYVTRTIEGESYPVFCRSLDPTVPDVPESVMLDCNHEARLAGHGGEADYFNVNTVAVAPGGDVLAWSLDLDGGELYEVRFRNLATRDELPDRLTGTSSWGGACWSADGQWFFYASPDEQMRPHQIWRHRLGTDQADDTLVLQEDDLRFSLGVGITRNRRWVIVMSHSKTTSECWLIPGDRADEVPRVVVGRSSGIEYDVDCWGDQLLVLTNLDAPDFRVMTAPHDDPATWTELVPHEPGTRILGVEPFAGHLVVHQWRAAQPEAWARTRDSDARITLDFGDEPHDLEIGSNPSWDSHVLRVVHESLTSPSAVYDYDLATGQRTLLKQTPTPGVDLTRYISERLWAPTDDGKLVPIDVMRHVDTPVDGTAPAVLYAYGSYEASMAPWFSVARLSLVDRGFVWALAHPRGGGELGREWYLDGKLLNKRNTFTDTLAAADHLVATEHADPERIAIRGGSAGGLLVGACLNLRAERFAAAVAEVPFVDVVSTMSDETLPLTAGEWEEWGDPREEPYASYIAGYSPYDNVATGADPSRWPALLVTAGLNDPRVSYHEPAKWVARLRAVGAGTVRPLIFRIEMGAGHGGPSGRYETWRDEARILTFLLSSV